jgi:hypothetical protein
MTVQEMDGRFCHPPSVFTLPLPHNAAGTWLPFILRSQATLQPSMPSCSKTSVAGSVISPRRSLASSWNRRIWRLSHHRTGESRLFGMTWIPQGVGPDRGLIFHLCDTLQGLSVTHNAHRRLTLPSLPKNSRFPKTSARAWQPTGLERSVGSGRQGRVSGAVGEGY